MNDCVRIDIPCPACGAPNNAHGDGAGSTPEDGDYGICWSCHAITIYAAGGTTQRMPSAEEYRQALADPDVRQAMAVMRETYDPHQAIGFLGQLT